jgi:hypothetical protein
MRSVFSINFLRPRRVLTVANNSSSTHDPSRYLTSQHAHQSRYRQRTYRRRWPEGQSRTCTACRYARSSRLCSNTPGPGSFPPFTAVGTTHECRCTEYRFCFGSFDFTWQQEPSICNFDVLGHVNSVWCRSYASRSIHIRGLRTT